jgi:hypothetical protein
MKKIFMALVLATILALPFSAFAMTTVADSDLSTVTGQAGVSINMDINMDITINVIAWGDRDGITNPGSIYTERGFVGLSDLNISNLRLRARNPIDDMALMSTTNNLFSSHMILPGATDSADATNQGYFALQERFLTIDVGSNVAGDKTVVRIGVPTLMITMDKMTATVGTATYAQGAQAVGLVGTPTAPYANYGQQMGSLEIDNLTVLMGNEGSIDISGRKQGTNSANGLVNQGVDIGINTLTIDWMKIQTVAWGDADGLGLATTAGYVGLYYTLVKDVVINGGISIDVATLNATTIMTPGAITDPMLHMTYGCYLAKAVHDSPDGLKNGMTFVAIGILDGTYIHVGFLDTVIGLASSAAGIGTAPHTELGEVIMSGLSVTFDAAGATGVTPYTGMQNGNYVHILAH